MSAAVNYQSLSAEELVARFLGKTEEAKKKGAELTNLNAELSELRQKNNDLSKQVVDIGEKVKSLDVDISAMRQVLHERIAKTEAELANIDTDIILCNGNIALIKTDVIANANTVKTQLELLAAKNKEHDILKSVA